MAYQFCDTFDYYNTSTIGTVWDLSTGTSTISSSFVRFPAVGSYPNNGVFLSTGSTSLRKNLKSSQTTLIAFISFGASSLPVGQTQFICCFQDSGTPQTCLGLNSDGSLQFYRQAGTFSPAAIGPNSGSGLITASSVPTHGIEIAVTFSTGSAGSVACWLDGNLVIPTTGGLKTSISANSSANQFSLGVQNAQGFQPSQTLYCDYVRVWDASGSSQNAALGSDRRKLTKLPQGAGSFTQWTPNGLGSNWQCVSSIPPNVSDYTSSSGSNTDSYTMGSAGLTTAPSMVVAKSYVEKDDGATRSIEIGVLSSGVSGLGSPAVVSSGYAYTDNCIAVDPNTGSAATASAADAYQFLKFESA